MKQLCVAGLCFFGISVCGRSQDIRIGADTIQVILENEQLRVTEYASTPGKDVCGKGKHTHPPHLSILLTDAKVKLTSSGGKTQDFDLKAGAVFWSEAETHMAINNGLKPAKVYLVELK